MRRFGDDELASSTSSNFLASPEVGHFSSTPETDTGTLDPFFPFGEAFPTLRGNNLSIGMHSASRDFDQFRNCSLCQRNGSWQYEYDSDGQVDIAYDDPAPEHGFVLIFNFWMLGVVMPLIAVFGILANGASIVVLTRPFMRSSTINIYLAGLSVFDGLLLLMSLLLYPALSFCELDHTDPSSPWCRYFFYSGRSY